MVTNAKQNSHINLFEYDKVKLYFFVAYCAQYNAPLLVRFRLSLFNFAHRSLGSTANVMDPTVLGDLAREAKRAGSRKRWLGTKDPAEDLVPMGL